MAGLRPASVHHTSIPGPGPRPIRPRGAAPGRSPISHLHAVADLLLARLSSEGLGKALGLQLDAAPPLAHGKLLRQEPGGCQGRVQHLLQRRGFLLRDLLGCLSEFELKCKARQHLTTTTKQDGRGARGPHTPTHPHTHTEGDWPASQPASPPRRPPAPAPALRPALRPRLCGGGLTAAPRGGGADACRGAPTCWASGRRGPGSR